MAITKYDLDINKQAIIKPVVILRQGDHDIDTMQVSLSVANEPMDLTGATVTFMGNTANGRQIIDDAHVKIIDAKGGVFEYVFPSQAASDIGEYKVAYFSIILANGQSSTMDFRVQVLSGVDISAPVASEYITHYDTMVTALNSAYDSATKATNQKMASTVSSLATSAATVLDSALARANTVNSTANNASSAASKAVSMASSVASTVTSQASYINSVASSAASNVSSVAAGVVDKLNNISVGGRNYILNTGTPIVQSGNGKDYQDLYDKAVFYAPLYKWGKVDDTYSIHFDWSLATALTTPMKLNVFFNQSPWQVNEFTIPANTLSGSISYTVNLSAGIINASTHVTSLTFRVNSQLQNGNTLTYSNLKFEHGNIPTDWSPAPEDAPFNDAQLVHKTGNEPIAGDKTFTGKITATQPINGALETRTPTFTDFNDVAKNMVKYSGSWAIGKQSIANSPLKYYYTATITPGFSDGANGYIELVQFVNGSANKYIAVVGSGTLSPWKVFAFDDGVVHKTSNETVAGDKTFTGNVTIPKNKVTVNTAYGTFTLTKTLDIVHIQSHISKDIPDNINVPNVVPQGFRPDGVSIPMTFIHGLDKGVIAVNPDGSLYTSSNIVPNTSFLAASWAVAGN